VRPTLPSHFNFDAAELESIMTVLKPLENSNLVAHLFEHQSRRDLILVLEKGRVVLGKTRFAVVIQKLTFTRLPN
jgi:hypothetical protein